MQGLSRVHLMWGKKIAKEGFIGSTHGNVHESGPETSYYQGSRMLRQLVWKIKSQWKQAVESKRRIIEYSYDLQSYSMNFDEGFFIENLPHTSGKELLSHG